MNKVGSKELSKHIALKPKTNWQFKLIMGCILFFSTIILSMLGALTVGRALIGIITFTSLMIPIIDSTMWAMLNLGTIIITLYVFYRLYRFHAYILNKVYLSVINVIAAVKIAKQDQKQLEKKD